ncbi:MAG TPA: FAD-dependent monooxygenase [Planctomycetota bacterium]|nr:FAD-dependent monooxygenase [Planctomycetota bacterium]
MVTWDAVVVGGSVAGSTAARELARRGLTVALVDKARFPRPKACGEGLLPHGLAALREAGIEVEGCRVRGLRFVSPSGATAEADFPGGSGLVVRRERFDERLFRAAAATPGVTAFEETLYDPERFPARWVVGADGLRSQFHRRPEFPAAPPALRRVGLSTHVRGLEIDRDRVEVLLHESGEVYLAPSEHGEALVACLFRQDALPPGPSNEDRVLHVLLSLEVLAGRTRGLAFTSPVLAIAPLGLHVGSVVSGNTILVGDAAGAPDPVTGEGMSLAILSARAGAEAIAAGRPADYELARRRLAAGSNWLGRWLLRATRYPRIADRVVSSLVDHPELFTKLLEISGGLRREGDLSLVDVARLVV